MRTRAPRGCRTTQVVSISLPDNNTSLNLADDIYISIPHPFTPENGYTYTEDNNIVAPNDEAAMEFGLKVGSLGNVRTTTLRAFTEEEIAKIIGKLG